MVSLHEKWLIKENQLSLTYNTVLVNKSVKTKQILLDGQMIYNFSFSLRKWEKGRA